jgi:uncharacterized protein YggE
MSIGGPVNQTIAVSGTGAASAPPDLAIVDLGVEVVAGSVAAARAAAATAMEAVLASLREHGVSDAGLTTTSYTIRPEYDHQDRRRLRGYRVINLVEASIADLEGLGDIIDSATISGGEHSVVHGLRFAHQDPTALAAEARARAWESAKAKAQQLAELAGIGLGGVVAISEKDRLGGDPSPFRALAAVEAAAPIEAGELTVTITVQVEFEID